MVSQICEYVHPEPWGNMFHFLYFHPYLGNDPIRLIFCLNGLKPPPSYKYAINLQKIWEICSSTKNLGGWEDRLSPSPKKTAYPLYIYIWLMFMVFICKYTVRPRDILWFFCRSEFEGGLFWGPIDWKIRLVMSPRKVQHTPMCSTPLLAIPLQ